MRSLYDELRKLDNNGPYPMHMPGHKRNSDAGEMSAYFDIDITEIDGFDNLHDAEGIIREAEERANALYGAEETHFLVNGSTCGVMAAVSASVHKGGTIIVGRNCHKSLYHAAYLRELNLRYLYPCEKKVTGGKGQLETILYGEISDREIKSVIEENPEAEAVLITSPTYEGIVSDIRTIADIVHRAGMILIVDEAHGAHFGMSTELPESAVSQGADIVIHSVHKTLASMTQTALIHVNGDRVDRERLRRFLRIYQSSSPSYVLMSSIDSCVRQLTEEKEEVFRRLKAFRNHIDNETKGLRNIYVPGSEIIPDPCKVLICAAGRTVTGQRIYDILRLDHNIQLEMAADTYALAIITGFDTDEGIERFISALKSIDKDIEDIKAHVAEDVTDNTVEGMIDPNPGSRLHYENKAVLSLHTAWDAEKTKAGITGASGRVSAEFINLYPPGVPLIVPGEIFTNELITSIQSFIDQGLNVQGVDMDEKGALLVNVVRDKDI
jgi:arginine/lysine/ornithine decarboxylase